MLDNIPKLLRTKTIEVAECASTDSLSVELIKKRNFASFFTFRCNISSEPAGLEDTKKKGFPFCFIQL